MNWITPRSGLDQVSDLRNVAVVKTWRVRRPRPPSTPARGVGRGRPRPGLRRIGGPTAAPPRSSSARRWGTAGPRSGKHLDAMVLDGDVIAREQHVKGACGRGRPAKIFALTDARPTALRPAHLWRSGHGHAAVDRQGRREVAVAVRGPSRRWPRGRLPGRGPGAGRRPEGPGGGARRRLSGEGDAASASAIASGGQLCQHHARWPTSLPSSPSCARPRPR